jgi:hypothetical protein
MKYILIVWVLFFVMVLNSGAQSLKSLRVKVSGIDKNDSSITKPVKDAEIKVGEEFSHTDSNGYAVISHDLTGTMVVTADASGFISGKTEIDASQDEAALVLVPMKPNDLYIIVQVLDKNRRPLEGFGVLFDRQNISAVTDRRGEAKVLIDLSKIMAKFITFTVTNNNGLVKKTAITVNLLQPSDQPRMFTVNLNISK